MARFLFNHDKEVAAWAAFKLGLDREFVPPFTAMGVLDEYGTLVGALVFTTYTGYSIELTVVAPGHLSRGLFRSVCSYVFDQLGCVRMTMTARAANAHHVRVAERIGFKVEGVIRCAFGGDDGILMGMLAEERW